MKLAFNWLYVMTRTVRVCLLYDCFKTDFFPLKVLVKVFIVVTDSIMTLWASDEVHCNIVIRF